MRDALLEPPLSAERLSAAIELSPSESLTRLQTRRGDILVVHDP
jgi:aryl-alcohol dehydrogenase-like predicted oxidoreductase